VPVEGCVAHRSNSPFQRLSVAVMLRTTLGACPRIGTVARESHFESDFSII
jgi:hypothetical protein